MAILKAECDRCAKVISEDEIYGYDGHLCKSCWVEDEKKSLQERVRKLKEAYEKEAWELARQLDSLDELVA